MMEKMQRKALPGVNRLRGAKLINSLKIGGRRLFMA